MGLVRLIVGISDVMTEFGYQKWIFWIGEASERETQTTNQKLDEYI